MVNGPSSDNFDPGFLIEYLYEDLVEVEALTVTDDEAVTNLPVRPRGRHGYTLVNKTAGRAQAALERGEAPRAAQSPKHRAH